MKGALALIFRIAARIAVIAARVAITAARIAGPLPIKGMKAVLTLIVLIAHCVAGLFSIRGMKRALALIVIITACVVGFLSIRGAMPFMAVFGTSMEPELHTGNLILMEQVSPFDVEVGDIIVFTIPSAVREHYNYPPVIAHRVKEVRTLEGGVVFRTKGDNSGEDPFTVRPQDLKGQVTKQISYLGLPLLFFQSQQGLFFIIIGLSLFALYLFADELSRGRQRVQRGIFAPIIEENQHTSQVLEQRIGSTQKGMEHTQQALNSFASAMAEYAQHLQAHTSAIQGLSEASQELKKGAAEQNKVLSRLLETTEQISPKPRVEEIAPKVEVTKFPPGCVRNRPRDTKEEDIIKAG